MLSSIDKQLVFDHFANRTTPLQKRRIDEWLSSEANQEQFYVWLVEWENQQVSYYPILEESLQKFVDYMNTTNLKPEASNQLEDIVEPTGGFPKSFGNKWWRWLTAASIFIVSVSLGWQTKNLVLYQTYQTAYGQTLSITLPDGSLIDLQSNSKLVIPRFGFNHKTRQVWLKGEGNFSVTHTEENLKFLVKTDNKFDVEVHGTEFTVNTRSYRANVMLRQGKVQVNYSSGTDKKQIILKPGDLVSLEQPSHPQIQHHIQPKEYNIWKEHRFVFDNMTLQNFGQLLVENYGLSVEIGNDTIARRTLVGSFKADNVDELLQIITEVFNLKVSRQGNKVSITGQE